MRWQRVFPDGTVVGPVTVATAGQSGDEAGSFDPFGFIELATVDGAHLVSWSQNWYDARVDVDIGKARFAVLAGAEGTVVESGIMGGTGNFDWDWGAHAGAADGQLVALWSKEDLSSPKDTIPAEIMARSFLTTGTPVELGATVEQAPDSRGEPVLFDHPGHKAAMAWIDHRTYTELGIEDGQIQLHVASLSDQWQARPGLVYPHARFYAGLTDLGGVTADHNVLLTWRDLRTDGTLGEMWFETAWIAP